MGESISTAIFVSLVGMVTVFVILGLVVLTGKALIRVVNTFFPLIEPELEPATPTNSINQTQKKSFDKSTLAAIITTVETITYGKGKINRIEKIT